MPVQPGYPETSWESGIVSDTAIPDLPAGAAINIRDWLIHRPGLAEKRGGTSYASNPTAGSYAAAAVVADLPAGTQTLLVNDAGDLYKSDGSLVGTLGAAFAPMPQKPLVWVGGGSEFVVFTANDGATAPVKYDGAAISNLGGLIVGPAPPGRYACLFKNQIVLANWAGHRSRLQFSPSPDANTEWDLDLSWFDADHVVTGLAALQNQILIWSAGHLERLTGTTAPPGGDMVHAPVAEVGCTDARSVTVWRGNAVFANPRGVYVTAGGEPTSLTGQGGFEKEWHRLLDGYDPGSWVIATGTIRSRFLLVTVLNGAALVETLLCDLGNAAWTRVSNVKASMYAERVGDQDDLLYADRATPRLVSLKGIFSPSSGNTGDADGSPVLPLLDLRPLGATRYYRRRWLPDRSVKHFRDGHVNYLGGPLRVSRAAGLTPETYQEVEGSPLPVVADDARRRVTLAATSPAVSLRVELTEASARTELYGVEWDEQPLPYMQGGVQ